jgi:hypothetical protein
VQRSYQLGHPAHRRTGQGSVIGQEAYVAEVGGMTFRFRVYTGVVKNGWSGEVGGREGRTPPLHLSPLKNTD